MELEINFPQNLITKKLIRRKKIPFIARVASEFEIVFSGGIFFSNDVIGIIHNWDYKELTSRTFAGAGGKYTHYDPALITFEPLNENRYQVIQLLMFEFSLGWCVIIEDGEYAELHHYMKAISSRENEEEACVVVGKAHDHELENSLLTELKNMDAYPVAFKSLDDLYGKNLDLIELNYYQFPIIIKRNNEDLMLEGPKEIVNGIIERAKKASA